MIAGYLVMTPAFPMMKRCLLPLCKQAFWRFVELLSYGLGQVFQLFDGSYYLSGV